MSMENVLKVVKTPHLSTLYGTAFPNTRAIEFSFAVEYCYLKLNETLRTNDYFFQIIKNTYIYED